MQAKDRGQSPRCHASRSATRCQDRGPDLKSPIDVLRRASNRPDAEASDLLFEFGDAAQVLLASELYTPRTVEVDGSVLLADSIEDASAQERWSGACRTNSDRAAVEQSFNLLEVPYSFADRQTLDDDDDDILAQRLAESWRAWLPHVHPGRRFRVLIVGPEEMGSVVALTFSEDRAAVTAAPDAGDARDGR